MLILFTILVVLSAIALLATISAKRRNSLSSEQNPLKNFEAKNFRPLFEPTEAELRAFEQTEKARIAAEKAEETRRIFEEKAEKVAEFEKMWSAAPDRKRTIEFLFLAAQSENAKIFSDASENVIDLWRKNRIENLTAPDLADLLDSHFRILPQQERTSGAMFWLREEIERLRAEVRGN